MSVFSRGIYGCYSHAPGRDRKCSGIRRNFSNPRPASFGKKYTNNLTIIYDGDAAGIKAALRGLDLAIEEGLNVQLVLIPDKEDPDSYVKKSAQMPSGNL